MYQLLPLLLLPSNIIFFLMDFLGDVERSLVSIFVGIEQIRKINVLNPNVRRRLLSKGLTLPLSRFLFCFSVLQRKDER